VTHVLESRKRQPVRELEQLTLEVRRDFDVESMKRAKSFMKRSTDAVKPFFLYFNLDDALSDHPKRGVQGQDRSWGLSRLAIGA